MKIQFIFYEKSNFSGTVFSSEYKMFYMLEGKHIGSIILYSDNSEPMFCLINNNVFISDLEEMYKQAKEKIEELAR